MIVKLGDICDLLSGNAWKASGFQDSGIPIVKINNMNSNNNDFVYWNEYYDKKYIVNKGDLLLSISGTIKTFKWNGPEALLNQRILKITSKNSNLVNIDWVYYQLSYEIQKISNTAKEAIIKNISINSIKSFEIDLPNINIQNKIVSVLDKALSLVAKRDESLFLIDKILKATFWNYFGDLGVNKYNWPKFKLVDLSKNKGDIRCGPFGTQLNKGEFSESGIPLWGIKHVNSNFKMLTTEFVSAKKAKDLSNYILQSGDIAMTRKGTIGNSHIYPENFEVGIMHSDILRIRVDESKINPYFLSYQFKYNEVLQSQINKISPGVVMAGINVSKLKKVEVIVPDIVLQEKFNNVLIYIEKLKSAIEDKKLDMLFQSLIQKAFNGQLNFNVDLELDSLINEIDLQKKDNNIKEIAGDIAYLQRLIDKLNTQGFKEKEMYDKAKIVAFQLMNESEDKRRVSQVYDEKTKNIKLTLV